jgi:rod shape determining protein RodA
MKRWLLPTLMLLLALISVLILKSVAPDLATQQTVFFMISFVVFFLISKIQFSQLKTLAWPIYILVILLLVTSYFYGVFFERTGRWITLFGRYNLQPSQFAIPATVLVLSTIKESFNQTLSLLKALAIIALPAILILIEPDLGTTLVYLISTGVVIFVSKITWKKILTLLSLAILGIIFSWFFILRPYQKQRITSFTNSDQDTQDSSYNAKQALIAAGSGQIIGRGLGQGVQSHLRFLPERQTDFIFASLAEEFGFIGSIIIIILYISLISFIIKTGLKSSSRSEYYYCLSIAIMTAIQTGVNIGMNIGLMPITGLTLPLLSYGGSSILSLAMMYAVIQSIAKNIKPNAPLHLS